MNRYYSLLNFFGKQEAIIEETSKAGGILHLPLLIHINASLGWVVSCSLIIIFTFYSSICFPLIFQILFYHYHYYYYRIPFWQYLDYKQKKKNGKCVCANLLNSLREDLHLSFMWTKLLQNVTLCAHASPLNCWSSDTLFLMHSILGALYSFKTY